MARETTNYERALNAVKNHPQWNNLNRMNTNTGTPAHVLKKRAQAEVALAEGMLSSYAISQAINDESNMLIGLFENYNEHLHVDIASNPQLAGAELDVPGGSGPGAQGSQLQNSNVQASNTRAQQQEQDRRRAEEERTRKAREDEAERERLRKLREDEERAKKQKEEEEKIRRAAEEAEAARVKTEIAAKEEKKRQEERERMAELVLKQQKQAEEEEKNAKLKAKQMEEEQKRKQEEKRKFSSESSDPYVYSQSNRGAKDAGQILREDDHPHENHRAKEPRLINPSPFTSGEAFPMGKYGDRDESAKSTQRQVQEETSRLQDIRSQYSGKKLQIRADQQQQLQSSNHSPNFGGQQIVNSAGDLVKLFGSQTLLNKAISIEEERQVQRERVHKAREMEYIEKYELAKKEGKETEKADAEKIAKLREELAILRERKKRSPVSQLAEVLPDKDSPQTRAAIQRISEQEDELIAQLETLLKRTEDVAGLHAEISKESAFLLGKQKGTLLSLDRQKELQAEIFALNQQKENLQLQALKLKRELEDGVPNTWNDPEIERKQNLENSITAMKRLNELKSNELNRNKALLEQLDNEYREYLKNPKYISPTIGLDQGRGNTVADAYGVKSLAGSRHDSFLRIADPEDKRAGRYPYDTIGATTSHMGDFRATTSTKADTHGLTDFSRGLQEMLGQLSGSNPRTWN